MTNRISLLAIGLLLVASSLPVSAVTLQPGSYRLEWKVPAVEDIFPMPTLGYMVRTLTPTDAAKYVGLKTSNPRYCKLQSCLMLLDESKGAGSGYDTAYFVPEAPAAEIDLSQAPKASLTSGENNRLLSDPSHPPLIDLPIGPEGAKVVRKVGVRVSVTLQKSPDGVMAPFKAGVDYLGNWFGKIPSDAGDVDVQVVDRGYNGVFNDPVTYDSAKSMFMQGDAIVLREPGRKWDVVDFGKEFYYGGRVYSVAITPAGDSLTIQPYTGETGTLRYEVNDGSNRPISGDQNELRFYSTELGLVKIGAGSEMSVPAGIYAPTPVFSIKMQGSDTKPLELSVLSYRKETVAAGQKATFTAGGPISIELLPKDVPAQIVPGQRSSVTANVKIGPDDLVDAGNATVGLTLLNSSYQVMANGQQPLGSNNPRKLQFGLAQKVRLETYWLNVTLDLPPYQESISAQKQLRLVPMILQDSGE